MLNKAVFLDRDGVINKMVYNAEFGTVDSPATVEQFNLLNGVGKAILEFNKLGFLVVIVSNQPGIAKGKFKDKHLKSIETKMLEEIKKDGGKVDAIYYCLHHPESKIEGYKIKCDCRKPKPGMLLKASKDLQIDLKKSYLVGDGVTDILAAQAVETKSFFVSSRKCYICDSLKEHNALPDYIVNNLSEAALVITNLEKGNKEFTEKFLFSCK